MKEKKSSIFVIAVSLIVSLIMNFTAVSAAEPVRYVDDITDDYELTTDIAFSTVPDYTGENVTLKLDVYEPANDNTSNRAVVIYMHGGNLQFGDKAERTSIWQRLVKKGFVLVSVNYRLNPDPYSSSDAFNTTIRNAAADAAAAVQWIRDNAKEYGMDADNIILGGHSSGAEIVTNLYYNDFVPGLDRSGITAVISLSGSRLFWPAPEDTASTLGDQKTKCLVFHGSEDTISLMSDIEKFMVQLGDRGVAAFLEGYDHYWQGEEAESLVAKTMTDFLSENVVFHNVISNDALETEPTQAPEALAVSKESTAEAPDTGEAGFFNSVTVTISAVILGISGVAFMLSRKLRRKNNKDK